MADIALVHLALDSSAVKTGADQSAKALKSVSDAADHAEKKVTESNKKIGDSAKKTADSMGKITEGSAKMGGALNTLGGNVGSISAQLGVLGNAIDTTQAFVAKFGLIGGVAATAALGVSALSAALVKLTLSGVEVSDQIGDIAEETGFSVLTITKLAAAYRLSGEDIGSLTRAVKTFTAAVVEARDPASDAAIALKRIGTDSVTAGRDIENAFIKGALQVKELRQTVEGADASNLLFSKGIGALVRQQDNFNNIFSQSEEALRDSYIIPTKEGIEAGGRLDAQINKLNNTWTVFTQNLAATSVGAAMESSLGRGITALASILALLERIERNPYGKLILGGVLLSTGGAFVGAPSAVTPESGAGRGPKELQIDPKIQAVWDEAERKRQAALNKLGDKAGKAAKEIKAITEFTPEQIGDPFKKGLELAKNKARDTEAAIEAAHTKQANMTTDWLEFLSILSSGVEKPIVGAPPAIPKDLAAVLAGQPVPGEEIFKPGPSIEKLRTEEQARIDAEFTAIFDNFLFTILTAQGTLGDAFKGLATGILDTFAREMINSMQESFIQPLARGLTDLLKTALGDVFSGLGSGGSKGLSGFFGGVFKGIGKVFGGIFGGGGTLGPGKFGIAGERGPELIFSGSQPMHIAPVTAGSAGNVFNITIPVNAPAGTVDRRTQDQLAVTVLNAVKRAQRNEGSR